MKKLIILFVIILSISVTANAAIDTFYNELDDDAKASVMQDFANNSYSSLDEMQQAMYDATLLEYINNCTDLDTIYIKLEEEGIAEEILGYTRDHDLYVFVDEAELEKRILAILPADSLAAFKTNATTQFVLCVLGNCPYYYIKNVLCEYNDVLGIDLSEFLELYENEEYKVLKKLEYRGYANAEQLQARLNTAVAEVKKASVTPSVGGGGGIVIERTVALGLDVKSLSEQIVPDNDFDVIVYADYSNPSTKIYEIGINFDNEYFELKDVCTDETSGDITSKEIDNANGIVDFTCNMGDKILVEDEVSGKYIIATLTFKTLKDVDKTLAFEIDEMRTTLLKSDGNIKDYSHENLDVQRPEAPRKILPFSNSFMFGEVLKLATNTIGADIYYTTDENKSPDIKYVDGIALPEKNVTYYAVAKKYGVSSEIITIELNCIIITDIQPIKPSYTSTTITSVDINYTDTDGNAISRPENGEDVIININSTGNINIYKTPYVFVAVYDSDGRMKDIYSSAYASEIQFATKYYVGGCVKFFVVSDYTKLMPIHLTKVPMM